MNIIDPHLHLFDIEQGDYQWLHVDKPPFWPNKVNIAKSYQVSDLALSNQLNLSGFVHIEAGFDNQQPWRELAFIEKASTIPFRTIAFLDLTLAPDVFQIQFNKLASYKSFVGIRHILEEVEPNFFCLPNVIANLTCLAQQQYIFELQTHIAEDLAVDFFTLFLKKHPNFRLVINHAGFMPKDKIMQRKWHSNLSELAKFKNVAIKCSGLEMKDINYSFQHFTEIVSQCLTIFGLHKVMLASNFPVITLSRTYQTYWQQLASYYHGKPELWLQLSYQNALNIYQFKR